MRAAALQKKYILLFLLFFISCAGAKEGECSMSIDEVSIDVAPDFTNKAFAFNGQVPDPLIGRRCSRPCNQQHVATPYHSLARHQPDQ